jgi:beta-xylosidase
VNWRIAGYAFDRLDLGPAFRLEDGKEIYGQGIWAPSFRYYKGTYCIFANVNRFGLQVFRASDPRGPWKHNRIEQGLHDLSVLFDDDGRIYAVYAARTIRIVELNPELTGLVPGTDRVLIGPELGMGEASHFYKLNGKYYIVSAIPGGHVPMKCARADRLAGPWEVETISEGESLGIGQSYRLRRQTPPFEISPPNPSERASLTLHQGGIIDTVKGEWWGFSMQDHNGIGRLTSLSPVTWVDGWPYFGLPGNLTRTPKTWVKPDTGHVEPVTSPYDRSDDFSKPKLQAVWQWNHLPDDSKWSLTERPGYLRLHSLPARDFWWARNSLTQRAVGPESTATTDLDASGLQPGDVAGLALLNLPYSWIGVKRDRDGFALEFYDQTTGESRLEPLQNPRLKLQVHCNFDVDSAQFSYSVDGREFKAIGDGLKLPFQLKTFQGVRYALFHYNTGGSPGGQADFDDFVVSEPRPRGLTKPIPHGQRITFADLSNGNVLAAMDGKVQSTAQADLAVHHRDQVQETLRHPDVRDIRAPHLVDALYRGVSQQIRVDLVTLSRLAQLRLRIDGLDSHHLHQPRDPFAIHFVPLCGKPRHHSPASVEWRPRVLFIQQSHQQQVLFAFAHWFVIQACAVDTQQLALPPNTEVRMAPFHQRTQFL